MKKVSGMFYLKIITAGIWLLLSILDAFTGKFWLFILHMFCATCWGYLSFLEYEKFVEEEKEKKIKVEKQIIEEKKLASKEIDFFHVKEKEL
jgi:hypothetical protein